MTESSTYGYEFKGSPHLWKKFCMQPYNLLYSQIYGILTFA